MKNTPVSSQNDSTYRQKSFMPGSRV